MSASFESLADRLDAIAEELADAAIGELKSAVARGEHRRPDVERVLTQARRSVGKAAHLLRRADTATGAVSSDDLDHST